MRKSTLFDLRESALPHKQVSFLNWKVNRPFRYDMSEFRHRAAKMVYFNILQQRQLIRARAIQQILLKYSHSRSVDPLPLRDIYIFSMKLSALIGQQLDRGAVTPDGKYPPDALKKCAELY